MREPCVVCGRMGRRWHPLLQGVVCVRHRPRACQRGCGQVAETLLRVRIGRSWVGAWLCPSCHAQAYRETCELAQRLGVEVAERTRCLQGRPEGWR